MGLKLNLGCGGVVVDGWVNVDYSLGAKFKKIPVVRRLPLFRFHWSKGIVIHDLRKPFPWKDAQMIYSSHFLEHLDAEQGSEFLQHCRQALAPGGIIRIVVPDLGIIVSDYRSGSIKATDFLQRCNALYRNRRFAAFLEFPHRCMYDAASLLKAVSNAGFECVLKKPFESDIEDIRRIEQPHRTERAVIVEGTLRSG